MSRKRFWVATSETGPLRSDWFAGGFDEAAERWPDAQTYIDATDMPDDDFEYLVRNGKPRYALGGRIKVQPYRIGER